MQLRPAKKIALLGFTEHRNKAPFADPAWQIWGINDLYLDIPPEGVPPITPDRLVWFQLHAFRNKMQTAAGVIDSPAAPRDGVGHVNWLREAAKEFPVILIKPRPDQPDALILPKPEIMAYFGSNYFTNSVSWMLGLAIMQRPSCEWLLGWARAAGIKITIPAEGDLLKAAFPYGDEIGNAWRKKLQAYRTEMSRRRGMLTDQRDQAVFGIAELTGAINAADHWLLAWMPGDSEEPSVGRTPLPDSHKAQALLPLEEASDGGVVAPPGARPAFTVDLDAP